MARPRRLERQPQMLAAVGLAGNLRLAAEMETLLPRVSDRPSTVARFKV